MTDSIEFSLKSGIVWGNKVATSTLQSAWHSSQGRTAFAAVQTLISGAREAVSVNPPIKTGNHA